jgi:hypothetical protein
VCPISLLVSGQIPVGSTEATPLEADDREFLANATQPGSTDPASAKLWRALSDAGYRVGVTAIQRHRRSECMCSVKAAA